MSLGVADPVPFLPAIPPTAPHARPLAEWGTSVPSCAWDSPRPARQVLFPGKPLSPGTQMVGHLP